jgi:aspartyl/asparaginyl beta-hydroxylase (cupin superfamily)
MFGGKIAKLLGRQKEVPAGILPLLGEFNVASMKDVVDAFVEIDRLPTIAAGLRELGYKSTLEPTIRRDFYRRQTRTTHPLQQPYLFLPGVPAKNFYDAAEFPWTKPLEDAYPVIRRELDALLSDGAPGFKIYRSEFTNTVEYWNTYNLFVGGEKLADNCARVPETMRVLESLPRFEASWVLFSALNSKAHIPPHVGPINGVLRGHLPLIVPRGCRIRVGNDTREWQEGKMLVFDDSFVHEVWNESDGLRVVLFLNFWHPCFAESEIPTLEKFRWRCETNMPFSIEWRKQQKEPRPQTIEVNRVAPIVATASGHR